MCNSLNEIGLEHRTTAHSYNICVYGLAVCLFAAYVPNLSVSTKMRHIYYYLCFSCVWPIPSRFIWILAHTQANQSIAKNCTSCLYRFNAHTHILSVRFADKKISWWLFEAFHAHIYCDNLGNTFNFHLEAFQLFGSFIRCNRQCNKWNFPLEIKRACAITNIVRLYQQHSTP